MRRAGPLQPSVWRKLSQGLFVLAFLALFIHTDSNGEASYNEQLSLKRARSVADVLMSVGMPPANLDIRGRGEAAPIADNGTAAGRAENRRVAIVIDNG